MPKSALRGKIQENPVTSITGRLTAEEAKQGTQPREISFVFWRFPPGRRRNDGD